MLLPERVCLSESETATLVLYTLQHGLTDSVSEFDSSESESEALSVSQTLSECLTIQYYPCYSILFPPGSVVLPSLLSGPFSLRLAFHGSRLSRAASRHLVHLIWLRRVA